MFNSRIFFISMLSFSFVASQANDSLRTIDVLNNSKEKMKLGVTATDLSLGLDIPALAKAGIIIQIKTLDALQDSLFVGIFKNSAEEISQAIAAGANVNKLREGKTPLAWALSFNLVNAAACLMQYGAKLG